MANGPKIQSLDELFDEHEAELARAAAIPDAPEVVAARKAKAAAELQREIRAGIRDENGDYIEQPDAEDADDEDDEASDETEAD